MRCHTAKHLHTSQCVLEDQRVGPVAITADPIHHIYSCSGQRTDGTLPAVTNGSVGMARVEPLKLLVQFEHVLHSTHTHTLA